MLANAVGQARSVPQADRIRGKFYSGLSQSEGFSVLAIQISAELSRTEPLPICLGRPRYRADEAAPQRFFSAESALIGDARDRQRTVPHETSRASTRNCSMARAGVFPVWAR